MVSFDTHKLIRQLLPTFLRKPIRIAWLEALIEPLKQRWGSYIAWRADKLYELNVTPQTISIEAYLNRLFDPIRKRITIPQQEEGRIYVCLRVEQVDDMYVDGDEGAVVYLNGELAASDKTGFTVEVPAAIDATRVAGVISKVKLTGVNYKIEVK